MTHYYYLRWCLLLVLLVNISIPDSLAQSVKRQSIGSIGSGLSLSEVSVRQTVGQPYFTGGYIAGEVSLRPGFQQSYVTGSVKPGFAEELSLRIYPNPAVSSIHIQSPVLMENATVRIFDMQGKTVFLENVSALREYTINCQNWREGFYFISLYDQQTNNRFSSKLIINK